MAVPYTFGSATSSIPLSQLDSNFATGITLGNTTVYLGNTTTSFGNVTLTNVTISSVAAAITPSQGGTGLVTIPANNVMLGNGTANVTVVAPGTTGNVLTSNGTTWASTALSAASVPAAGSTTQVQYNNAGAFAGSANLTFNGTTLTAAGLSGPHNGTVGATTPSTGAFTTLSASSTVSGTGFSTYLASPPAIGGTAPAAGAFTTLTATTAIGTSSGGTGLTSFTSGGVVYASSSSALATGSALTFDGTSLSVSGGRVNASTADTGGAIGSSAQFVTVNTNASIGDFSGIRFNYYNSGDSGGKFAYIGAVMTSNSTNGIADIVFGVKSSIATTTITEQLRLTSTSLYTASGINVGIGTSSPATKLHVQGGAGQLMRVTDGTTGASIYSGGGLFGFNNQTGEDGMFGSTASHYLYFATNGAEKMRLDSAGNLGLGTSSPSALAANYTTVDIRGTTGGALRFGNATDSAYMYSDSNETNIATATNKRMIFSINTAEKMRLDTSGNLGLGTAPVNAYTGLAYKNFELPKAAFFSFDVTGSRPIMGLKSNIYYDSGGSILFNGNGYAVQYLTDTGNHQWYTSTISNSSGAGASATMTQAMTLDASGRLGIGETSPTQQVHAKTVSTTYYLAETTGTGASAGFRMKAGASADYTLFTTQGTNQFAIYNNAASTQPLTIDSSGNLLVGTTSGSTHSIDKSIENDYSLNIRNTATANTYGITSRFPNASPNGAGNQFLICSDSSATRMLIYSNGGIANYAANNVILSDRREKINFQPAKSYLDVICLIPVQTFNYVDQNRETDDGLTLGVVAQDVQSVAPELVTETNWGSDEEPKMRLSIYQTDLQYALMKCIQEQQAIIESLKARLDAANL